MLRARDFSQLRGRLLGISDRLLAEHLQLYERAVTELNAIEAAYPMTSWGPASPQGSREDYRTLLATPVKDLELEPQGTLLECIITVMNELASKGLQFAPNFYLGEQDFWTTDRAISINIPWFLANPTLWRLALRQLETAYTPEQVLRCLRHELGHAVNYAYGLWDWPEWEQVFGAFDQPYRDSYPSEPRSEEFVEYLTGVPEHYAQKHPDEDWAETFACWLDPASGWREKYASWPKALAKLEFVDALLGSFKGQRPGNKAPGKTVPYTKLKGTVGQLLGAAEGAQPFSGISGWSEHAELLRREPVAYNAVVLHELYFEGLAGAGQGPPEGLQAAAQAQWGSWESYLLDLRAAAGSTHGWALTCYDPRTGRLRNALVEGHHHGVLAGAMPLLAIDCWEHAYAADYGTRKDIYLAAFFRNVDWARVELRRKIARGIVQAALEAPAAP